MCDGLAGEEVFVVGGAQDGVSCVEFLAEDVGGKGEDERGGLEDGKPGECDAGVEWGGCEELQLGTGQRLEAPTEFLFDAFGCGSGAGLEGVGGADVAFGGGPVAVGEESVRNDPCQLGPEGERGEAEGISVRRDGHKTGHPVGVGDSLHQGTEYTRNQLLRGPARAFWWGCYPGRGDKRGVF